MGRFLRRGGEENPAQTAADHARMARDANPLRRFEYKVVRATERSQKGIVGGGKIERRLNALGARGWELAGTVGERLMFKREIAQISEAELQELAAVEIPPDEE